MNIKYIIAIAAAALMLPGCDRTDLETSSLSDGNVRIKVSGLQLTKGTLINSEEEMLAAGVDEFTVQAWNSDYSSFVTKQAVRYNTAESKWQTASPIAWTGTDSKTFFASANLPASGATVTNTCTSTGQKQTLEYTLPLDAREQNDVMLGWYGGNGGGVQTADITFVHPLSSIILKRGEMEIDGIKSITVSGLYASGTVGVTYSKVGEVVVPAYNWGTSRTGSVVSTLEPEEGQSVITVADDGTIGTPFVVIPQSVAAGQVKICVSATVSGKDKSLVVNVPAGAFEAGKTHVFTLGYSNRDLLPGKFSVSATEYVQFSRGNLFCTRSGSEGSYSYTFGFESNQYDYRCRNGESQDKAVINGSVTTTPSQTSGLFQWIERNSTRAGGDWGAFTRYSGADSYDAYGDVLDFGGVFPESDWTTLTQVQWQYLLDHHTYKHITVNGVYGLAIAPDGYEGAISASYDSSSWSVEEGKGVVFLPLYGYGNFGTNKIETHEYCYWSLTSSAEADQGKNWAIALHSRDNVVVVDSRWRTYAQNVRLVQKFFKPQEFVDLGLPSGTLWAKYNVGADSPEGYGDYFQWGGVMPVTSTSISVGWANCPGNGGKSSYHADSFDTWKAVNLTDGVLKPDVDAATANWGPDWCMPTKEDWQDLYDNTTSTWTDNYNGTGVKGMKFTSKVAGYTDKDIFLPAAGYREGTGITHKNEHGDYWSSSLYSSEPDNAYDMAHNPSTVSPQYHGIRSRGFAVRPVRSDHD